MRSLLFVPASMPRMFEKARASKADVVIYDLEDAVQPAAKTEARELLMRHLAPPAPGWPAVAIRVNGLSTDWCREDIEVVSAIKPDYVMLPKAEGAQDVAKLAERLGDGLEQTGILVVATETVASVLSLAAASWTHPRLKGMLWGAEDLSADLGATSNRNADGTYSSPFRLARDLCLMAARKAGVIAIDAVHTQLRDLDDLRQEADAARRDGFDAKAAIHPSQVAVINDVFHPSDDEVSWARRILEALAGSATGVAVVDGVMMDAPHAARARRILGRR
jgi:citrate lyase subunit beta/citryl-CoA lyase